MSESEEKKKVGYFLPGLLIDRMEDVRERTVTEREKWQVIAAAFTMFLHANPAQQDEYIALARWAAGPTGSFDEALRHGLALMEDLAAHRRPAKTRQHKAGPGRVRQLNEPG